MTNAQKKDIGHWLMYPLVFLVLELLIQQRPAVLMICTIVAWILNIATEALIEPDSDEQDQDVLRNIIVSSMASIVLVILVLRTNPGMQPWGNIGWVIVVGVTIVASVILFIIRGDGDVVEVLVATLIICFLIGSISCVYLFFLSQWIWVPIVLTIVTAYTGLSPQLKIPEDSDDQIIIGGALGLFVLAGLVSTVCQFWYAPFIGGIKMWHLFIACIVGTILLVWYILERKKSKEIAEKAARETAQKLRDAQLESDKKTEEENKERIYQEHLGEYAKLGKIAHSSEPPKLLEIIKFYRYGANNLKLADRSLFSFEHLLKTSLLELITEVSTEKKKITWNGECANTVAAIFGDHLHESMNDHVLLAIEGKIEELKNYEHKTFMGFYPLLRVFLDNSYVKLYFEEKTKEE